jgi:bacterioferritin
MAGEILPGDGTEGGALTVEMKAGSLMSGLPAQPLAQIDYLGKMPTVTPKPVKTSDKTRDMLKFDLDNENVTILNYRERVRQCEALGEFAMAEQIREILVQEQDHQIDLATALGEDVPDVSKLRKRKG